MCTWNINICEGIIILHHFFGCDCFGYSCLSPVQCMLTLFSYLCVGGHRDTALFGAAILGFPDKCCYASGIAGFGHSVSTHWLWEVVQTARFQPFPCWLMFSIPWEILFKSSCLNHKATALDCWWWDGSILCHDFISMHYHRFIHNKPFKLKW